MYIHKLNYNFFGNIHIKSYTHKRETICSKIPHYSLFFIQKFIAVISSMNLFFSHPVPSGQGSGAG